METIVDNVVKVNIVGALILLISASFVHRDICKMVWALHLAFPARLVSTKILLVRQIAMTVQKVNTAEAMILLMRVSRVLKDTCKMVLALHLALPAFPESIRIIAAMRSVTIVQEAGTKTHVKLQSVWYQMLDIFRLKAAPLKFQSLREGTRLNVK